MWITPLSGRHAGAALPIGDGTLLIGRGDECDVTLDDPKVSRRHASVRALPDGRAAVHDLGSANGVYVDGRRTRSAVLCGGERLQIGDSTLLVTSEELDADRAETIIETLPPELLAASARASSRSRVSRVLARPGMRRSGTWLSVLSLIAALVAVLYASDILPVDDAPDADVTDAVAAVAPSTVLVATFDEEGRSGSGSGWVYDADAGLVATNAHVLNGGTAFRVGVGGALRPAEVVAVAPCEDLALLRVGDRSGLRTLPLGSQAELELGQTAVAVGFPASASHGDNLTSTTGVISVVRTSYREASLDVPPYPNVLQTDAAINPGNSGGPLVSLDAELIGVNSAGRTLSTTGRIIQGQGYAIGVDRVAEILPRLRSGRSLGWAGLRLSYLTREELRSRRLPPGVRVEGAVPRSGASLVGLERLRGWLLLSIGGRAVGNSLLGYCDAVLGVRSGARLPLELLDPDSGRRRRVTVRFG